jgi:hypothetical protein
MPWVNPPVTTSFYTIRTADGPNVADDPVSYTPGQLVPIHIRVLDLDRKFIGLVSVALCHPRLRRCARPPAARHRRLGTP